MHTVLTTLNQSTFGENFVLKGGTGLLLCHGLNRFSEDIDLDGIRKVNIEQVIVSSLKKLGFSCSIRLAKDTDTVTRYMIDYGSNRGRPYPLKIEISYRNARPLQTGIYGVQKVNGIRVYSLGTLANMKLFAFLNRDKIRDFYDLSWLVKHHPNLITRDMAQQIYGALLFKGVNELVDLLVDEATADHILDKLDTEAVMLEFIENLERILNGGEIPPSSFFSR